MKIVKIKTAKGKEGIEIDKFRYRKDKTLATGEINRRCTIRGCASSVKRNHAVSAVKNKPSSHNHKPPDSDASTFSSPSTSEPAIPNAQTPSQETPFRSTSDSMSTDTSEASSLEVHTPSLKELLSPHVTLTPNPPKFLQLEEENAYLRQRVAELTFMNEALTDKLISVEKENITLKEKIEDRTSEKSTIASNYQANVTKEQTPNISEPNKQIINPTQSGSASTQTEKYMMDTLQGIQVLEADMGDVIDELRTRRSIAFAHTIPSDFHHRRQMSAGVAVKFRERFDKLKVEERVTRHLACQTTSEGATVYSLITKANYYGKPSREDYDTAFNHLTEDFEKGKFSTLICSPMGNT